MGSSGTSMGSGFMKRQQKVISAIATAKGGAMIPMNSGVGILNLE